MTCVADALKQIGKNADMHFMDRSYKPYEDLGYYDPSYCKDKTNEHGHRDSHCLCLKCTDHYY